ncbi:UDP-N-acetyl-2-amino-2-deoxy-D-glucuronate oxidase [Adhaeretor mobilis]|uniref:UDP-N-acetyl-2-amino-2-deoxy-D-glucuronate oxidase n=2 Tax=Adhaeretor mobilis TaxID=1930276 RepID=A0A517MY50_9BACT|nr:UDP-N-acetyl-2-amino-2-deoxy-D-glucuronate oxidase [Adhaeretor mobilis]
MNFGLIGAAGYIAPKHIKAIHETGNSLVAAADPHDCVGRLDSFFPEARFFTEIERFDRYLEKRRRGPEEEQVQYVSVCSPNYLHDAHVRLALRVKAHAICEKPLVISPWNLDALEELEAEHGRKVFSVLQLRLLPSLLKLREDLQAQVARERADICLTYITRRGCWYDSSWKGAFEKSGGVALNIGIHFFDLLHWLFGEAESSKVHLNAPRKMAGVLEMNRARVRWFLSTDADDLPEDVVKQGGYAHRSMTFDGQEIEFSGGFTDLHTRVYEEILAGRGTGITEARPSIDLAHSINNSEVEHSLRDAHPFVSKTSSVKLPAMKIHAA